MKLARILIVALALTMLAASTSFGAVIAFRTGTLNEIAVNAQTGLVGNIGLVPLVPGTIPAGEIVNITLSHPISSITDLTIVAAGETITFAQPVPAAFPVTGTGGTNVTAIVNSNVIRIQFNALVNAPENLPIIEVSGIRVNVCPGGAIDQRVSATITSVLGQVAVTDPDVDVAVMREPIGASVVTNSIVDNFQTTGGTGSATVRISEVTPTFTNAFETRGATAPTQIRLTVTVPADLSLTGVSLAGTTSSTVTATIQPGTGGATFTNPVLINITGQDQNAQENIDVVLTFSAVNPPIPLNLQPVTVQATFVPSYTVFPVQLGVTPTASAGRLGYCVRSVPATPLEIQFGVESLETRLLSTFNVSDSAWDTGIAILNASAIFTDATAGQPGTISYTLYPYNAAPLGPFTTSATNRPGIGLDANGSLPEGNSWNVLVSQLLPSGTTSFRGAIVFTTAFSGAEGINFVADQAFEVQAQGYQMLVIGGDFDRIGARNFAVE